MGARDRYCAFFAAFLERQGEALKGERQVAAQREIGSHIEDARAAWDLTVEGVHVERLDQALDGLCLFYELRGRFQEGETACRVAAQELAGTWTTDGQVLRAGATSASEAMRVSVRALAWASFFHDRQGKIESARSLVGESLALLDALESAGHDVRREKALALQAAGFVEFWKGVG